MARKIFVSYKYADDSVEPINGETTARAYVDGLIELFEDDEIYKGEGDEDLGDFKDETIETHLKDKIYDSSLTIVLISPEMKEDDEKESDQWIPWEISYSLKSIKRKGITSHPNGLLAVTLPDSNSSYSYFIQDHPSCNSRTIKTDTLFQILKDNMFNIIDPNREDCGCNPPRRVYTGEPSYIKPVKWSDFIDDKDTYLDIAGEIRDKIDDYEMTKIVKD